MTIRTDLRDRRSDARQVRFYETLTVPKKTVQDAIEYLASTGFSISGLTSETPVMADSIPFSDASDSNTNKKATFTAVQQLFDDQNWSWTGTHAFGAGVTFAATVTPATNDAAALGTGALSFSDLFLASGAVVNWNNGDVLLTHSANALAFTGATTYLFDGLIHSTRAGAPAQLTNTNLNSPSGIIEGDYASPAANDFAYVMLRLSDSAGNQDEFARITWTATDVASSSEDGRLSFGVVAGGTLTNYVALEPNVFRPNVNDGTALGSGSLAWSDAFFASGATLNFNNGDVVITHSANLLTLTGGAFRASAADDTDGISVAGGTNALRFRPAATQMRIDGVLASDFTSYGPLLIGGSSLRFHINNTGELDLTAAALLPVTNDGLALGSGSLMWADLFLASGGTINFNNGDVTLTHSANLLTLAGGDLSIGTGGVFTAGTIELGAASDTTLSRASAGIAAVEGIQLLKANGGQTITGGFTETSYNIGSVTGSNQTITPNPSNGGLQYATLNGSSLTGTLTFAAPSAGDVSMVVQVINGGSGSVGATLSTSGYTKVTGDAYATTNGNKYNFYITRLNSTYHLHIQALQ